MPAYLSDCQTSEFSEFNGVWLPSPGGLDETKIPPDHGRAGRNLQYFVDAVGTRYGHTQVFVPGDVVTTMTNWIFEYGTPTATPHNYLAWFASGKGLRIADIASPTPSTIITDTTSASAFILPFGSRLYIAFIDANGIGIAAGQVYGFGVGADPLFAAPIATVPTFIEAGSNFTTVGAKLFGYLIQTRNGYITRPSPATGNDFTSTAYTSAGGAIIMTVDPPSHVWPSYAQMVAPIMTTTANPAQFFIVPSPFPGTSPFSAINHSGPTVMLIEITDTLLTSTGIDATPYLTQLGTPQGSTTPPFLPSFIGTYGQRNTYTGLDSSGIPVTYCSDSSNPQSINAGTSGVYLPGQLGQTLNFALRDVLYILGPHWTYSTQDSNGVPATWPEPQLVDGSIGALGPQCVSLNASQNYAWVADEAGLYLFQGGVYPSRPVSYYQRQDWFRINFAAPLAIQVVDDKSNQRVYVLAPLDGATTPTGYLTWDYSNGTTAEAIQYSGVNTLSGYNLGAIAMVQSSTTKHLDKWVAPANASQPIGRDNNGGEVNPYRDFSAPVNGMWETATAPQGMAGRIINHHAARMRIRGNKTVALTVWGLDHQESTGPFTIPSQMTEPQSSTLVDRPGVEILQSFYLENEYSTIQIENTDLDSWFQISKIDLFYTPSFPSR